jgi:hypothetical protein
LSLELSGPFYILARTGFGLTLTVREWMEGESSGRSTVLQLASEVCALLFLLGFTDARLRTAVGNWWFPLFMFAVCRELARIYAWYVETVESASADDATAAETLVAPLPLMWELLGVMPPVLIGAYLVGTTL